MTPPTKKLLGVIIPPTGTIDQAYHPEHPVCPKAGWRDKEMIMIQVNLGDGSNDEK